MATAFDRDWFLREARHAAGLRHPGIVTIHDAGHCGETCYMVSEYMLVKKPKRQGLQPARRAEREPALVN